MIRRRVGDFDPRAVRVCAAALVLGACAVACGPLGRLTAVERGRRLAAATGCFACHGADGRGGVPNPGRRDKTVPGFGDELMMYAKTPDDVRAWIRDGATPGRAASQSWRAERDRGVMRMPAFGRRLTRRQIDDLAAFIEAAAGRPEPDDSLVAHGRTRAAELGCFGCHGPGGRFERPNPGAFKPWIPAWDGPDFPELVRNRGEFEQWVRHGRIARFQGDVAARFFLRRERVKMPAFEGHLEPGDLDALWAYIGWLRGAPVAAGSRGG